MRKNLPLIGILLACVLLTGAGCKASTTGPADTNGPDGSTTTTAVTGEVITIVEPTAGSTITSPFGIRVRTTKTDQMLYFRVKDKSGSVLVTAEGQPNPSTGEYYAPYMMFFGGKGAKGTLEAFHKDGAKEIDLVSIPVNLE